MKTTPILTAILASAALCATAPAASIAMNFAENAANQVFAGGTPIGPTGIDSANWNSSIDLDSGSLATGTKASLVDDTGAATTASIEWSSSNVWYNGDGVATDEAKLAVGYLDDGGTGATFTISDIPYAEYTAYILFTSDNNGDYTHTDLTIAGNPHFGSDFPAHGRVTDGTGWVLADGTTNGNYAMVSGLTDSTLTVSGGTRAGAVRGPITGVIIEEVPEPSMALLLGLGGLGLLLRRRK